MNIDEYTVYREELFKFFQKNPSSPCYITSLTLVKLDENPNVERIFNVITNTFMDIYAPDDLQELRNSPSVVAWPTDLAEFNFLVEANNDYRRGAVS